MAIRIILDANLLVLLVVGATDPSLIEKHKRLSGYSVADHALLLSLIRSATTLVVTPNTLTEASNLLRQIGEPARSRIQAVFRAIIGSLDETYVESRTAAAHAAFPRLGLADTAQLQLGGEDQTLLTTDLALYRASCDAGHDAINFNHVRDNRTV